jgi:nucleotidyltransferase/DNA polymerase involved in DNA repair
MMVHDLKTEQRSVAGVVAPPAYALPVSKLRGVPASTRAALKRAGINTCARLLERAGSLAGREALARATGVDTELLLRLVQRADMARVNGVGAVFSMMLEDLGVRETGALARQDPIRLHAQLRELNGRERMARRSPTPEEVADWIAQARALERLVEV